MMFFPSLFLVLGCVSAAPRTPPAAGHEPAKLPAAGSSFVVPAACGEAAALERAGDVAQAAQVLENTYRASPSLEAGMAIVALRSRLGQVEQAEALGFELAATYPGAPGPVLALAGLARSQGQIDRAITILYQGLERMPPERSLSLGLATSLAERGEWEQVVSLTTAIPSQGGRRPQEELLLLAEAKAHLGELEETGELLKELLDQGGEQPPLVWSLLAACEERSGNLETARGYLDQGLGLSPAHPQLLYQKASLLLRMGSPREALPLLGRAAGGDSPAPEALFYFGIVSLELGDTADARKSFLRFLNEPRRQAGLGEYYLAITAQQAGNPGEALEWFSRVPLHSPQFDLAQIGKARIALGKSGEEGRRALDAIPLSDTSPLGVWEFVAQARTRLGDFDGARRVLARSAKLFPAAPSIAYLQAVGQTSRDASDPGTLGALEGVVRRFPRYAQGLNHLGYTLACLGTRATEAVHYLARAMDLEPENGYYRDSFGWALFKSGQADRARMELERARDALHGQEPIVFEHLGEVYLSLGLFGLARDAFSSALALFASAGKERDLEDPEWPQSRKRVQDRLEELAPKPYEIITPGPSPL